MSYYDVLGLTQDCDRSDIRRQYKKLAAQHHPDQPTGNTKKFQEIQEAYECLSDNTRRTQYDMNMNAPDQSFMHGMFSNIFNMNEFHNMFHDNNQTDEHVDDIYLEFKITLMDVHNTPEVTTGFNRIVMVDDAGTVIKEPSTVTSQCDRCKGMGIIQETINMGFFRQQSLCNCNKCCGKGYTINPGYKLLNKKQKFRRILPHGIEDDNVLRMEGEGNLVYLKTSKKFRYSDLYITTKYDIAETNRQLEQKFGFKDIRISNVYSGNIDFIYSANIFEFLTGTQFNLPLPNGRFLLIKISNLNVIKSIAGFGLPTGKSTYGNINIIFELKSLSPNGLMYICETDKLLLRRIASVAYPKPESNDAIVVDFH